MFMFSIAFGCATQTVRYVAQTGRDLPHCGNITLPCKTIRFTVAISHAQDTISIDYANGVPYQECDLASRNSAIVLNKTLSFISQRGKPEIQCRSQRRIVFEIPQNSLKMQRISFTSIKLSHANQALANLHDDTRIQITNCLFHENDIAIYLKNPGKCNLQADDSTFVNNTQWGIYANTCANITVRLTNVTFRASPVLLFNAPHGSDQHFEVLVVNNSFYGSSSRRKSASISRENGLLQTHCVMASVLNVTVISSTFGNHSGENNNTKKAPIHIDDKRSQSDITTIINFDRVVVKNILTYQRSAVWLSPALRNRSVVKIEILNCEFFNNTRALEINMQSSLKYHDGSSVTIKDTAFIRNYNPGDGRGRGAAVTFKTGKYDVVSSRFVNNHFENRYLTGVVVLMAQADATFQRCHFENTEPKEDQSHVLQIYSPGNTRLSLKEKNVFNFVRLRRNQPIIIHTSPCSDTYRGYIRLHGEINLTCPEGYRFTSYTPAPLKKRLFDYLEFNCFQCSYKTYSVERGGIYNVNIKNITCLHCPPGGECKDGRLTAKPNFWGIKSTTDGTVHFSTCPLGYCCEDEDKCQTYNSCHGNRRGVLCGRCKRGTSELLFGTECERNEECDSNSFWIGISIIVPLYCLFFLYHKDFMKFLNSAVCLATKFFTRKSREQQIQSQSTETHARDLCGGYLKIIFYYYQIIHIFTSSVGGPGKIVKKIQHFLAPIFNLLVSNLLFTKCPFKDLQPVIKLAILHSLGFLLLLSIGFLYIAWKILISCRNRPTNSSALYIDALSYGKDDSGTEGKHYYFKCRIASAFTHVSLLMYSSSAQLCLNLLHCVPIGESNVLFIDGNLKCLQSFQYFILVYVVINIIPFCLVPVLGSYLLASGSISLTQFCLGCLFPLPLCCHWAKLLFKRWRGRISQGYVAVSPQLEALLGGQDSIDGNNVATPRLAILQVLLGPFRSHSGFLCFPESPIPWEGFLIFRRLIIIVLFTFVNDINLRMHLVLLSCVLILVFHLLVKPFRKSSDNILETLSLSTLIILCGFTHVKAIYNGGDKVALNNSPYFSNLLDTIESILIVAPFVVSFLLIICAVLYVLLAKFLQLIKKIFN